MEHFVPDLPEQFDSFGEARKNGFLKVRSIKEAGGRVAGIFCTFTPLEILDAAGFLPVSLCGMSDEVIPAAEAHLPKNLCPLIKSSYGFAVSQKCPYTYFADLIVGETTCDGKKKMYELLGKLKNGTHWQTGRRNCAASSRIWRRPSKSRSPTSSCAMPPPCAMRNGGSGCA